ncbi:hypothetical protein GCM10020221_05740 [Streptomyces thioluteus]|uniref:Uncharacterized protein n=1 Tax=Streptomyces thioluteus TaxID=66431 RepID=A0ABN3WFP6_STRTU
MGGVCPTGGGPPNPTKHLNRWGWGGGGGGGGGGGVGGAPPRSTWGAPPGARGGGGVRWGQARIAKPVRFAQK